MNDLSAGLKSWGCDVEAAMERMLHDQTLFVICIHQVANDPVFEALGNALEQHQAAEAFDYAHTLKGILATTGITPLYTTVCQMVESLRVGSMEEPPKLYTLLLEQREKLRQILDEG